MQGTRFKVPDARYHVHLYKVLGTTPQDEDGESAGKALLFLQQCLGPGLPHSRVIRAPLGKIVTRY